MTGGVDPGLCGDCRHARWIGNRRGSRFLFCELSRREPGFPRYPPLPVLRCDGFRAADQPNDEGGTT